MTLLCDVCLFEGNGNKKNQLFQNQSAVKVKAFFFVTIIFWSYSKYRHYSLKDTCSHFCLNGMCNQNLFTT